jgi:hypothetical protein
MSEGEGERGKGEKRLRSRSEKTQGSSTRKTELKN